MRLELYSKTTRSTANESSTVKSVQLPRVECRFRYSTRHTASKAHGALSYIATSYERTAPNMSRRAWKSSWMPTADFLDRTSKQRFVATTEQLLSILLYEFRVFSSELESFLRDGDIRANFICGLSLDICVTATARDSARLGFLTAVIVDCRYVTTATSSTLYKLSDIYSKVSKSICC
jgi:nicotinamidase-related amidase